jgi:hypothetical protein
MSLFSTISASLGCPRCHTHVDAVVHVQIGYAAERLRLNIGDVYPGRAAGGPLSGNLDAEGWCVCPECDADFFCRVEIRRGRIRALTPDHTRFPLGPDATLHRRLYCPREGRFRDMEVRLFAGHASPARHLQPGDVYLADEFPGLDATLRALGACGDERHLHMVELSVRLRSGRIAEVEPVAAPETGRIFL